MRQACSVYLKNRIQRSWVVSPERPIADQTPIPSKDRAAVRQAILPLLVSAPSRSIRTPLSEALRSLISHDFPERWPTLLEDTKRLLQSAQIAEVVAGCVAILELVRAFR